MQVYAYDEKQEWFCYKRQSMNSSFATCLLGIAHSPSMFFFIMRPPSA